MHQTFQTRAGKRTRFRAVFVRYEKKSTLRGAVHITVFLRAIREISSNAIVAEHLWFTRNKSIEALGDLRAGDEVEFDARIWSYPKRRHGDAAMQQFVNPITTAKFALVQRHDNAGNGGQ